MSRECGLHYPGWECPKDGLFECIDLKKYFESSAHAYFVKVEDEIAGFVLIDKHKILEIDFDMGQFFILAKFQRHKIGYAAAIEAFKMHPGSWSVGVIPKNQRALRFWRKVVSEYTDSSYFERAYTSDELKTPSDPDPYPMIIFTFESRPH